MQRLMSKEDKGTTRPTPPTAAPPALPLPSAIRMHESPDPGDSRSVRRSVDSGQEMRDGAGQHDVEEEEGGGVRLLEGRPPPAAERSRR